MAQEASSFPTDWGDGGMVLVGVGLPLYRGGRGGDKRTDESDCWIFNVFTGLKELTIKQ